nr:hypothetical protein [Tanacetum cinerariifolium]
PTLMVEQAKLKLDLVGKLVDHTDYHSMIGSLITGIDLPRSLPSHSGKLGLVTTHYLPKEREAASAKPHHMIASSNSRISSKNMTRFSSNDMVHNHYLEEAKKRTQERSRNSKPSLMHSARSQSTANGSKQMPRRNTQTSRIWPATKNSFVTTKTMPIAEHPWNSRNDSYVTKFLKEVNSHVKVPSNKTTTRSKPIKKISVAKKPERQIPKGHRFSIQKTSVVQKKNMTPRSCLRWKPTGKIFKTVGLRWVPTGRILTSSTTKVYSEPLNGSNADITNQYECEQILDVSAGTFKLSAGTSFNPKEEGLRVCSELENYDHNNEPRSLKLVPNVVPPACKTATTRQIHGGACLSWGRWGELVGGSGSGGEWLGKGEVVL